MGDNLKTILINVETILTDYVEQAKTFWLSKAEQVNRPLPDDFMESFLSAGHEALDKTFFRFPHLAPFQQESNLLFHQANQQINDSNPYIRQVMHLVATHDVAIGLIYDQTQEKAKEVASYLEDKLHPIIQLFGDDAVLGKPEGNIFLKAKALKRLKANDTWVVDATKNGILAAFLADMKGIYVDMGLGLSERLFKYSYRNTESLHHISSMLDKEKKKLSFQK